MNLLTKLALISTGSLLLIVPFQASSRGHGLGTQKNLAIIQQTAQAYCPDGRQRTASGACPKSHRSYFYGRSRTGGGFRYGK